MKLARESWVLIAICLADLVSTLVFVHAHGAQEANPIMQPFLLMGVIPFILAKSVFVFGPLYVMEWARRRRPKFVLCMMRVCIALYVSSYGAVVYRINSPGPDHMSANEMQMLETWAGRPAGNLEGRSLREKVAKN